MNRLAVIGTTLLDHVIYPDFTLEQAQCNKIKDYLDGGGAMYNIATQLSMLKHDVVFYTKLGNDQWAQVLRHKLELNGVDIVVEDIDSATPIFTLIAQEPPIMTCSITNKFHFSECPSKFDLNFDYLITDQTAALLWEALMVKDCKKIIAIGYVPENKFRHSIHSIIINEHEYYNQYGNNDYSTLHYELEPLGILLVITKGENGVEIVGRCKLVLPAIKSQSNFYLGCGDAFTSGWIHGVVNGLDIEQCAICGLQAATWCLTSPSAVTNQIIHLDKFIQQR